MRHLISACLILMLAGASLAEELFNGKDLAGWVLAKDKKASLSGKSAANGRFTLQDGVLVIDPKVKGDLILQSEKEIAGDGKVQFEFKPDAKCNNDLFFRGIKFDIKKPDVKSMKEGEWNSFEIVVKGNEAEYFCNGQSLAKKKASVSKSPFGIRAEFGAIEIRKLQFTPLP